MDRCLKLYNREFEVLPEAWESLLNAFVLTNRAVSVIQEYPDLSKMQSNQLDSFLEKCELVEWQKEEIRCSADKTESYQRFENLRKISRAIEASNESVMILKKKGIFIENELKHKFDFLCKLIADSVFEFRSNLQWKLPYENRMHESLDLLYKDGSKIMDELESQLKRRLWNAEGQAH